MIVLNQPTDSLQVLLGAPAATTELPWSAHWADVLSADQSLVAIGKTDGVTIGATGVTVLAGPQTGHTRTLKSFFLWNGDTTGATATVQLKTSDHTRVIVKPLLATGDTLEYTE